jgi:hypothetical protein
LVAQFGTANGLIVGLSRRCRAWSRSSRTTLNTGTHAARACTPFRAGRGRPRPAGSPATYKRITLNDREVPGERAPSRRSARRQDRVLWHGRPSLSGGSARRRDAVVCLEATAVPVGMPVWPSHCEPSRGIMDARAPWVRAGWKGLCWGCRDGA